MFIIYFILIFLIYSKNIILSFKRVSFEKFIGKKTLDDYINYDIYTDLLMGTPPQKVTNFIEPSDSVFQFKKKPLQYNENKFNKSITKIETEQFSLFNSNKSSTYLGFYSDNFIFNSYDNKIIKVPNLKFTIYLNNRDENEKYGIIGLYTKIKGSSIFDDIYNFVDELKNKEIIDDYVFTFIYENNNNYFNIELGKILIGEYSYIFNQNINLNEEVKIYSASSGHWSFLIDEIKFEFNNETYTENHIEIDFDFFSKFIKGSKEYNEKIKNIFLNKLLNDNLCDKKIISENKNRNQYEIYSCNNTNFVIEKLKNFPNIYFTIKSENLVFSLTYNDLFKLFEDRLYFMIIFPFDKYIDHSKNWMLNEIFLTKFTANFNLEAKTISFYKDQINKANNFIDNNESNNSNFKSIIRILVEILMGIVIIICIYLIYRKYRKSRKLLANELEDNNYDYIPNERKKENKLMNEKEMN